MCRTEEAVIIATSFVGSEMVTVRLQKMLVSTVGVVVVMIE